MPRVPAQPAKQRKFCRVELHPDAERYIKDLADDIGVQAAYIIRLCIHRALPEVEETLRDCIANFKELPDDELKRPTKPLKTTLRKPKPVPDASRLAPPPIAEFLESGEMPPLPEPAEPGRSLEAEARSHEPENPSEPRADVRPASVPDESSQLNSSSQPQADPVQVRRRRRG